MEISPARVCHLYYEERLTQAQIAKIMGCSRIQVSRLLQQARTDGIVTISIKYEGYFPELEKGLSEKYPGLSAIVVDGFEGDAEASRRAMAVAAGRHISRITSENTVLAVGWGSTMLELAENFPEGSQFEKCLPLIGGQESLGLEYHANAIAATIARRSGSLPGAMFAPAVAETRAEQEAFSSSRQVADVISQAAKADIAAFSLGSPFAESSSLGRVGYFSEEDIQHLRDEGTECDIISVAYFDGAGERCAMALSDRAVGVSNKQLLAIPQKVCVAGGLDKQQAIRIALENGYVNTLVTDADVARAIVLDS